MSDIILPKAAVYVDQPNLNLTYKRIDHKLLLDIIKSKYDVIRATSFLLIDNKNDDHNKFLTYLISSGFKCVTGLSHVNKEIGNMLTTHLITESNTLDHKDIVLISGDVEFFYSLQLLGQKGYKIHIIGPKDKTSIELLKLADSITYLEDIPGVINPE